MCSPQNVQISMTILSCTVLVTLNFSFCYLPTDCSKTSSAMYHLVASSAVALAPSDFTASYSCVHSRLCTKPKPIISSFTEEFSNL